MLVKWAATFPWTSVNRQRTPSDALWACRRPEPEFPLLPIAATGITRPRTFASCIRRPCCQGVPCSVPHPRLPDFSEPKPYDSYQRAIYLPASFTRFLPRHMAFSTWVHHMPFGYDLVAALRPAVLVELGTYNGLSFFCFCQAMEEHAVDGVCYAVDTWQGDVHTGAYGEEIYRDVLTHSREFYAAFSYLMRMQFSEALQHFSEDSIDLLHIDGLHTYEAVREDFEQWYPKVKPGGLIVMHDIYARLKDFGVWRFWEEIAPRFAAFGFKQGFGLGVIRKPGGPERHDPLFRWMFGGSPQDHEARACLLRSVGPTPGLQRTLPAAFQPGSAAAARAAPR